MTHVPAPRFVALLALVICASSSAANAAEHIDLAFGIQLGGPQTGLQFIPNRHIPVPPAGYIEAEVIPPEPNALLSSYRVIVDLDTQLVFDITGRGYHRGDEQACHADLERIRSVLTQKYGNEVIDRRGEFPRSGFVVTDSSRRRAVAASCNYGQQRPGAVTQFMLELNYFEWEGAQKYVKAKEARRIVETAKGL